MTRRRRKPRPSPALAPTASDFTTLGKRSVAVYKRQYYAYYGPIWEAQEQQRINQEQRQQQIQANRERVRQEALERQQQRALAAQQRSETYRQQQLTIQQSQQQLKENMRRTEQGWN